MQIENDLATEVIGAAIIVHSTLGPGLLESAYKECLFYELAKKGLFVQRDGRCRLFMKKLSWIVDIG